MQISAEGPERPNGLVIAVGRDGDDVARGADVETSRIWIDRGELS
jgi:hypothetical protein